jgi:hypothetical protein
MALGARTRTAASLALATVIFSVCVWVWILSQPEGTFHDQGGLAITLIYFPATFCVWLVCGLLSAGVIGWGKIDTAEGNEAIRKRFRLATIGLFVVGFCLSAGTLFLR